ncbi:unnamed protein product [Allacma fusca]|uniref:Secreted protein n=1 Tax=Allacma fusca TaxID=39272 RepID=A0A8J2KAZ3_9HEXA|nr:unnamed protein product [Allacma fusca]
MVFHLLFLLSLLTDNADPGTVKPQIIDENEPSRQIHEPCRFHQHPMWNFIHFTNDMMELRKGIAGVH